MSGSQINPPYKAVWVASAVRTGSMWAYNVARRALILAGAKVFMPGPHLPETDWPKSARAVIDRDIRGEVFCYKIHNLLRHDLPRTRFIVTYRDVRDSCLSYMRFMHADFETALQATKMMMIITDYYLQAPDDIALKLPYNAIAESPLVAAERIAAFLNLDIARADLLRLTESMHRDKISKLTAENDRAFHELIAAGEQPAAGATVKNFDGTVRFVHPQTQFQTNHVTSRGDGEWREALSREQQERLHDVTAAWLRRYGFPVD